MTSEDKLREIVGDLIFQIAQLQAENEMLRDENKRLETQIDNMKANGTITKDDIET